MRRRARRNGVFIAVADELHGGYTVRCHDKKLGSTFVCQLFRGSNAKEYAELIAKHLNRLRNIGRLALPAYTKLPLTMYGEV